MNAKAITYRVDQRVPDMLKQLEGIHEASKDGDVQLVCFCAPKRCHCETIKSYVESNYN